MRKITPLLDRFNAKWIGEPNSGCWLWEGATVPKGYGLLGDQTKRRKHQYAHRASWELFKSEIPDGLFVLHKCDNPYCVNPDHLFLGTQKDNHDDMVSKGRNLRGSRRATSVLKEPQIPQIRSEYASGAFTLQQVADRYRVSEMAIHKIISGKTWRHA